MEHFDTYCDLAFLERFVEGAPDPFSGGEMGEVWHKVKNFFQKDTNLHVDASCEDLSERAARIITYRPGSRTEAYCDPDVLDYFEERATPHTFFLVENTDAVPETLSRQFGAQPLSYEGFFDVWSRIGSYELRLVSSREKGGKQISSWEDLEKFAAPTQRLIVCDRYMFTENENGEGEEGEESRPEDNIFKLVSRLLPKRGRLKKHVTLVGRPGDPVKWRRCLKEFLKREGFELDRVSVCVARPGETYHDRHIFTDYGLFISGNSFNYFNESGRVREKAETILAFLPLVEPEILAIANDKLDELQKGIRTAPNIAGNPKWLSR